MFRALGVSGHLLKGFGLGLLDLVFRAFGV